MNTVLKGSCWYQHILSAPEFQWVAVIFTVLQVLNKQKLLHEHDPHKVLTAWDVLDTITANTESYLQCNIPVSENRCEAASCQPPPDSSWHHTIIVHSSHSVDCMLPNMWQKHFLPSILLNCLVLALFQDSDAGPNLTGTETTSFCWQMFCPTLTPNNNESLDSQCTWNWKDEIKFL